MTDTGQKVNAVNVGRFLALTKNGVPDEVKVGKKRKHNAPKRKYEHNDMVYTRLLAREIYMDKWFQGEFTEVISAGIKERFGMSKGTLLTMLEGLPVPEEYGFPALASKFTEDDYYKLYGGGKKKWRDIVHEWKTRDDSERSRTYRNDSRNVSRPSPRHRGVKDEGC